MSYILEGSGQKYGENIQLTVQLLDAVHDKHIWSNPYNRKIDDIFTLQSEIAQSIASEIKAIITPEEKQLIEKTPTTNLTAYDFYQRGREEFWKYFLNGDEKALERAENLYHEALKYDSTFAQAYTGLAWVYWNKHFWEEYFSEGFMDSVLILTDMALSYEDQLAEAYYIRGLYYQEKGHIPQALKEYDKAIRFNPNDWMAYSGKGVLYTYIDEDLVKGIENFQKASSLSPQSELKIGYLVGVCWAYTIAGFPEKAKYYAQEVFKLESDSAVYSCMLGWIDYYLGNFEIAIELFEKAYTIDEFFNLIKRGIEFGQEGLELSLVVYYHLAGEYAFRGEKDKAIENLNLFNQKQRISLMWLFYIKHDPLFDSIRDEPEFQRIVRDLEAKYQAEHERVRKWMEEQGI